jgi:hypothetical protein
LNIRLTLRILAEVPVVFFLFSSDENRNTNLKQAMNDSFENPYILTIHDHLCISLNDN